MTYFEISFFDLWENRPFNTFRICFIHNKHNFHIRTALMPLLLYLLSFKLQSLITKFGNTDLTLEYINMFWIN